ncbi:MAG: 4Fe-4S binding protein [Nitrospinota bacterium]
MPRFLRRLVQGAALALLIAVPAMNYGGVLYQQYGKNAHHTMDLMGTAFERGLYRLFSATVGAFSEPAAISVTLVGNFGSFSLFGVSLLDPVVAAETALRAPGAWLAILSGAALPLLVAALLGRVFCGWACPVNTILEGIDSLRRRALPRLGFQPPDVAAPRWLKWVLFLVGLGAAALADLALWANLLPHVQIGRDALSLMVFGVTTAGAPLLIAIILAELLLSRRVWCRSLCPTGAVLGWFGARALLRVRKAERACLAGCAACARACPMALNPAEPFPLAQCYNCALCASACPSDLLTLGFARPRKLEFARALTFLKRATPPLIAAVAFFAAPAAAHHMRGQPHYGYAENYPQVPTQETRARMGEYDVTVVSYFFEGLRRRRSNTPDDVQFYVSLTDSRTGQSYTGPLSIELRRGGRRVAAFDHDRPLEEAVYRIRQAVPGRGGYELRLSGPEIHGRLFVEVKGDTTSRTPYIVAGVALLIGLLVFLNRRRRPTGRRGGSGARGRPARRRP